MTTVWVAEGLQVGGTGSIWRACGDSQVTRRGMRARAIRNAWLFGQAFGHWTRIKVFNSVTRAAILMRRRRKVSNWTVRHVERLGMAVRKPHISQ